MYIFEYVCWQTIYATLRLNPNTSASLEGDSLWSCVRNWVESSVCAISGMSKTDKTTHYNSEIQHKRRRRRKTTTFNLRMKSANIPSECMNAANQHARLMGVVSGCLQVLTELLKKPNNYRYHSLFSRLLNTAFLDTVVRLKAVCASSKPNGIAQIVRKHTSHNSTLRILYAIHVCTYRHTHTCLYIPSQ